CGSPAVSSRYSRRSSARAASSNSSGDLAAALSGSSPCWKAGRVDSKLSQTSSTHFVRNSRTASRHCSPAGRAAKASPSTARSRREGVALESLAEQLDHTLGPLLLLEGAEHRGVEPFCPHPPVGGLAGQCRLAGAAHAVDQDGG